MMLVDEPGQAAERVLLVVDRPLLDRLAERAVGAILVVLPPLRGGDIVPRASAWNA